MGRIRIAHLAAPTVTIKNTSLSPARKARQKPYPPLRTTASRELVRYDALRAQRSADYAAAHGLQRINHSRCGTGEVPGFTRTNVAEGNMIPAKVAKDQQIINKPELR